MTTPHTKTCAVCGRTMEWRKKWAKNWDDVKYCSNGCRTTKIRPVDSDLEAAILELLGERANGATICPSEAAKLVGSRAGLGEDGWRSLMEPARQAARRLVAGDQVDITQKGHVVDGSKAKGPIRIRLR